MGDASNSFELSTRYDPAGIEQRLYARWLESGLFHPDAGSARSPYVIVIPPPNVTAALHMGHGLNNTIQDVLIRFQRMRGRDALWIPGTDHAGIATQNVVERELAKEGLTRDDLGREKFVQRMYDWVDEYGSRIIQQLKVIGCSCDWERTRFTLDEGLSQSVREVFVRLYEKGLVYRANYIINWCPRCRTALSNEEAEHRDVQGRLYHLRYPLADGTGQVEVATTRPETMLGDTALAVHPDDSRHAHLVGREVQLPLTKRTIPIVADVHVDPEFGSGVVKVTPAHDPIDFEIGRRHDLPSINVLSGDGTLGPGAPEAYRGLDRFVARERVVSDMRELGLLGQIEQHTHAVGHCYRCGTIIEPRLSLQWFVRMKPLAEPALQAYREGRLRFHPARFGQTYEHWMVNVRDWCISRQLWWGHRIPVWYCMDESCGETVVDRRDPSACPACGGDLRQDEDVLDTWFSSWLWPFSTLGWPEDTPDLAAFYPTHTLVTAPEILFFWVARMVMAGIEFTGELPFRDVLFNGTVRDSQGRRMSKSLGNGIDPLEVVERFGADAMRFRLLMSAGLGTDIQLDHEDLDSAFRVGRNFGNKMWNAARLVLPYLTEWDGGPPETEGLGLADRWILSGYQRAVGKVTDGLERFRFQEVAEEAYHFVWDEFCDWYLELSKTRLRGDEGEQAKQATIRTVGTVLTGWLRMLHPIMPFITEELSSHLPGWKSDTSLLEGPWPAPEFCIDKEAEGDLREIRDLVGAIRNLRSEYGIDPGRRLPVVLIGCTERLTRALDEEERGVLALARVSGFSLQPGVPDIPGAQVLLDSGMQVFLPLEGVVDLDRERLRVTQELERLSSLLKQTRSKLDNPKFTDRAPAEVVERERVKSRSLEARRSLLLHKQDAFGRAP